MTDEDPVDVADVAVSDDIPAGIPTELPALMAAGTYAMYAHPDGGAVIVWTDQDGTTIRKKLPAALLRIAGGGGGVFGQKMRQLMGVDESATENTGKKLSRAERRALAAATEAEG